MRKHQSHASMINGIRSDLGSSKRQQLGFTLLEVMITSAVSLIVIAAGFVITVATDKATKVSTRTADAQQNARIAMELISRDVRMAGFGMKAPVGFCPTPIVPQDKRPAGADDGSDRIHLLVSSMSVNPALWRLNAAVLPPGGTNKTQNTVALKTGAVTAAGITFPAVISIGGTWTGTVQSATGDVLNLDPSNLIASPTTFPVNVPIYWLQCITYQVIQPPDVNNVCAGRSPCLARGVTVAGNCDVATSPCVPIVDGIEDIQFAYACDGCVTTINSGIANGVIDDQGTTNLTVFDKGDFVTNSNWTSGSPSLNPSTIRLVQIDVVAREVTATNGLGDGNSAAVNTFAPLQVSDHLHSADPGYDASTYQKYRRRQLTKTVETRNIGLDQ